MLVVLIELPEPLELLEIFALLTLPLVAEMVTLPPFMAVTVSMYEPIDGGCGVCAGAATVMVAVALVARADLAPAALLLVFVTKT